jgi:hypothetical protein
MCKATAFAMLVPYSNSQLYATLVYPRTNYQAYVLGCRGRLQSVNLICVQAEWAATMTQLVFLAISDNKVGVINL